MYELKGGCHCGNITFDLSWPDDAIYVRKCSCTFCTKHNASWTSDGDSKLAIEVLNSALLTKYVFGTKTAEFLVCASCGVPPAVLSTIEGRVYAVVNVSTIDGIEELKVMESATNFDGEGTEDRLVRRKRNWINEVLVVGTDV